MEKDGQHLFLYGCSARTFRTDQYKNRTGTKLETLGTVSVFETLITDVDYSKFESQLVAGSIQTELLKTDPHCSTPIKARRKVIGNALGHSAIEIDVHYTLPGLEEFIDTAGQDAVPQILATLQAEVGFQFCGEHASRFGCFECLNLHSWLDRSAPLGTELTKTGIASAQRGSGLNIRLRADLRGTPHFARVVAKIGNDVVLQKLLFFEADGPGDMLVECDGVVSLYEVQIFSANGAILYEEKCTPLNTVSMSMGIGGRTITLQDDLARRAAAQGIKTGSSVGSYSSQNSLIGYAASEEWKAFTAKMADYAAAEQSSEYDGKWFGRSVSEELEVIAYFNKLIHSSTAKKALIADPYFGPDALVRFATRLGSQDIELTLVTSWVGIDPDTNEALQGVVATQSLEIALDRVSAYVNPALKVINLADGPRQAFHDRYLLIYPHEGPVSVFMLSNSINKMAGNWPFCITKLSRRLARDAQKYLEALLRGEDIYGCTKPEVTFTWPAPDQKHI